MIIYNTQLLYNYLLYDEATELKKAAFISANKLCAISTYPRLKTSDNILVRLGFMFLGLLLYSSISGTLTLIFGGILFYDDNWWVASLFYGFIGLGTSYIFAKQSNYYGQGLDDVFIIGTQFFFTITVFYILNQNLLFTLLFASIISLISYLRYLHAYDILIFGISFSGFSAIFIYDYLNQFLVPFVLMLVAIIFVFSTKKKLENQIKPYYTKGLIALNTFGLFLFYMAGNYLIVRETFLLINEFNTQYTNDFQLPFSFVFYTFTIVIPILYIVYSIIKKDRILLWTGLICAGFSIFTIRYYYFILPTEIALTIGGIILFFISYFTIKKIKNKTSGVTYQKDRFSDSTLVHNAQIVSSTIQFGVKTESSTNSPMEYGDGDFSGGGAGGEY